MARKAAIPFYDIGYARASLPEVISELRAHKIKTLIDVRDVANSRRAGFAKSALSAGLAEAGISYVHLRKLGTPKSGRDANRAGRMTEFWEIYERAFEQPEVQIELNECEALCRAAPSAMLCYCEDGEKCHRHRIAVELEQRGLKRVALTPSDRID